MPRNRDLPLVYSCSGCSSAAQLANHLAVRLDRAEEAEMSCIAGVGGGVKSLVRKAREARPIIAVDGCHLRCVQQCLAQQGVEPTEHIVLSDKGVKKRYHTNFDATQADTLFGDLVRLARRMRVFSDAE